MTLDQLYHWKVAFTFWATWEEYAQILKLTKLQTNATMNFTSYTYITNRCSVTSCYMHHVRFISTLLPTVTCTTFPSTTVATTGWASWNWQKFLFCWWGWKYQHFNPQCKYNCSHLSTSLPFPVNHGSETCWNGFCCLQYWSALPNHKCNRVRSGDKCIHYNCRGCPNSFSYRRIWTKF